MARKVYAPEHGLTRDVIERGQRLIAANQAKANGRMKKIIATRERPGLPREVEALAKNGAHQAERAAAPGLDPAVAMVTQRGLDESAAVSSYTKIEEDGNVIRVDDCEGAVYIVLNAEDVPADRIAHRLRKGDQIKAAFSHFWYKTEGAARLRWGYGWDVEERPDVNERQAVVAQSDVTAIAWTGAANTIKTIPADTKRTSLTVWVPASSLGTVYYGNDATGLEIVAGVLDPFKAWDKDVQGGFSFFADNVGSVLRYIERSWS